MDTQRIESPIIVEQQYLVPASKVWEALTQPEQMREWFFDIIPDFKPILGFKTKFVVKPSDRTFTHLWEVVEVVPNQKLKYMWNYEEYEGMGSVNFELFEIDDKTLLRLTNEGLESFPTDIPEFARESCVGGWEYFLKGKLKEYLEQTN